MSRIEIVGIRELENTIRKMGNVAIKHVRAAAIKGMKKPMPQARKDAPHDEGNLRRGIKLLPLKGNRRTRQLYRTYFDPKMNKIFQNEYGGYYPVHQEYGWVAENGRIIPGQMFITNAYNDQEETVEKTITDELTKRLEGEINKGGLKP